MIARLENLRSFNDGQTKRVSVSALADAMGGTETIQFRILDQLKTVHVHLAPNQWREISVEHSASGVGTVTVDALPTPQSGRGVQAVLNLDVEEPQPDRYYCSLDPDHPVSRGDTACPKCGSPVTRESISLW